MGGGTEDVPARTATTVGEGAGALAQRLFTSLLGKGVGGGALEGVVTDAIVGANDLFDWKRVFSVSVAARKLHLSGSDLG